MASRPLGGYTRFRGATFSENEGREMFKYHAEKVGQVRGCTALDAALAMRDRYPEIIADSAVQDLAKADQLDVVDVNANQRICVYKIESKEEATPAFIRNKIESNGKLAADFRSWTEVREWDVSDSNRVVATVAAYQFVKALDALPPGSAGAAPPANLSTYRRALSGQEKFPGAAMQGVGSLIIESVPGGCRYRMVTDFDVDVRAAGLGWLAYFTGIIVNFAMRPQIEKNAAIAMETAVKYRVAPALFPSAPAAVPGKSLMVGNMPR